MSFSSNFILKSRRDINSLVGYKTEPWMVGFANRNIGSIYLLANNRLEKESSHKKYSQQKYSKLIRHELSHLFFGILVKNGYGKEFLFIHRLSI